MNFSTCRVDGYWAALREPSSSWQALIYIHDADFNFVAPAQAGAQWRLLLSVSAFHAGSGKYVGFRDFPMP
jgi:hypothetical protein